MAHHDCQGDDRRIHALVIGVGRYLKAAPRYGTRLESLPGAALAAYRFAHYLINEFQHQEPHGRRLATLRLLLSPLERERDSVKDLRHGPAERQEVAVALQDWAYDCNTDDQNLAVLYVAGHGVALGKSTSLLFLADAPTERSLALAAINLRLTEDLMSDCAAKNNLFFYDRCAVQAGVIPGNQAGALAISEFPTHADGKKRASLLCVNAARVGTESFAIGKDGTLLARGLLGDYRDRTGDDALLRIAGELVPNVGFGITPHRLNEMLSPCLQGIAVNRRVPAEGYEATLTLTGQFEVGAITVPRPTPMFKVTLKGLRSGRTSPVAVTLLDFEGGSLPLITDGDDFEDIEVRLVPAGDYTLQINGGDPPFQKLQVTGERTVHA
ncbi:hypothetical protein GR925_01360 [Streptomyces sp. HUCO-GS316]|uniref:caspase family protein n=1 Tax=Streptomyces sp. HUCO-GS316 TaxID=2692198 RepID=UPI00136A2E44|nr:caspase family protein [Streptomyces sp. HUCO-GS316]MXM62132.1 hypothetical protein [Streptomyces sp. HUCO-GS316]